ncbi:hypothetical protein BN136_810 [Cronobacter universalis NCTC 9529]|nr:hypothetical protein BN136_810 [Cronobacter universalis NCTC 9529]
MGCVSEFFTLPKSFLQQILTIKVETNVYFKKYSNSFLQRSEIKKMS